MPRYIISTYSNRPLQPQRQLRPIATRHYGPRPPGMSKAKGTSTPTKPQQASQAGAKESHLSLRIPARSTPTTPPAATTTMPKALPFKPTTSSTSAPAAVATPTEPLARSRATELAGALRSPNRARPVILAVGGAAIIALGSWYGVGLKIAKEDRDAIAAQARVAPEGETFGAGVTVPAAKEVDAKERKKMDDVGRERIHQLEGARGRLVYARDDLQRKIEGVDERAKSREGKAAAAGKVEERAGG